VATPANAYGHLTRDHDGTIHVTGGADRIGLSLDALSRLDPMRPHGR
jgi:hypothetical protein